MAVPAKCLVFLASLCLTALTASADEICLKDGKKLFGVIVAYEDNMFKVKTDFGYVLVEKDKIASIIPSTPATPSAKSNDPAAAKKAAPPLEQGDIHVGSQPPPIALTNAEKAAPKLANAAVKPEMPTDLRQDEPVAPKLKFHAVATVNAATTPITIGAQAEPPSPASREEVQGTLYLNHIFGFRMYKAPGWRMIDDARNSMPNAIVAMGTSDESTLLIVGRETTGEPLDSAAATIEKRLREIYSDYHQISRVKATVSGLPTVRLHFQGVADDHAWSGTLAVIARGADIFTILGMTYADSDLIQIQENVIARAVASFAFDIN